MTKEEYDLCASKLNSGTQEEQIQAAILLSLLPTYDSRTSMDNLFGLVGKAVKEKLKEFDND